MKSLQVLTPARRCIFNCPFCISRTHEHENKFINNYEQDYQLWKDNYGKLLSTYPDLKTVVITGTNEPMQDEDCVKTIINLTRIIRPDIQIEIQTRRYHSNEIFSQLDIVAFSISNYDNLDKIDVIKTKMRYVIILTDSFNHKSLKDILNKIPPKVDQLTFKVLHNSKGYNPQIDNWIVSHNIDAKDMQKLKEDIASYKGHLSIFFDETCMNATNRYMVFREDGQLYNNFEDIEPSKILTYRRERVK